MEQRELRRPQPEVQDDDLRMEGSEPCRRNPEAEKGQFIEDVTKRLGSRDERFADIQTARDLADYLNIQSEPIRQLAVALVTDSLEKEPEMTLRQYMSRLEAIDPKELQNVVEEVEIRLGKENEELQRLEGYKNRLYKPAIIETKKQIAEHQEAGEVATGTQGLLRTLHDNWQTLSETTQFLGMMIGSNPCPDFSWKSEVYSAIRLVGSPENGGITLEEIAQAKRDLINNNLIKPTGEEDTYRCHSLVSAYFKCKFLEHG
jgi:hypothetical protein